MDEYFIRPAGAARLAGVSEGTIRRWMDDPAVKVTKYRDGSGRVWVDSRQILAHIQPVPVTGTGR